MESFANNFLFDAQQVPTLHPLFYPSPPRRAQEEPEPEPELEPEDDLSQERPVSEDSISTHALVYGNEFRPASRADEDYRAKRCAYRSHSA